MYSLNIFKYVCLLTFFPHCTIHHSTAQGVFFVDGVLHCCCYLLSSCLCLGVLAAPFLKEEEANRFIRLKRQSGYWDPHNSQNQWGFTIQEQVTWRPLVLDIQHIFIEGKKNHLFTEIKVLVWLLVISWFQGTMLKWLKELHVVVVLCRHLQAIINLFIVMSMTLLFNCTVQWKYWHKKKRKSIKGPFFAWISITLILSLRLMSTGQPSEQMPSSTWIWATWCLTALWQSKWHNIIADVVPNGHFLFLGATETAPHHITHSQRCPVKSLIFQPTLPVLSLQQGPLPLVGKKPTLGAWLVHNVPFLFCFIGLWQMFNYCPLTFCLATCSYIDV